MDFVIEAATEKEDVKLKAIYKSDPAAYPKPDVHAGEQHEQHRDHAAGGEHGPAGASSSACTS